IYRFLAHVPIPLAETSQLKQLVEGLLQNQESLGFLNVLSGGALASFSIMLLGLGPYINASIIMQILTKAIPSLEERQKEGEHARRRINQYTRMLSVPLAAVQSVGILIILRQQSVASSLGIDIASNASANQWVLMILSLTAGSVLLMWLGEIITEKGIGNGISLVIFAGVASSLPTTAVTLWNTVRGQAADHIDLIGRTLPISLNGLLTVSAIVGFIIFLTYWVVKLNEAQRIVTVHYAKRVRGSREYGGITTIIPLKVIVAGVIPIIFAFSVLQGLQLVGGVLKNVSSETLSSIGQNLSTWFAGGQLSSSVPTTNIYIAVYFTLIMFFTYFYTRFIFDPHEISEQLQQQGGFIEGVKPGENTERYLNKIMQRLNLTGAISIGVLAVIPLIAERFIDSRALSFGGTSLIITVSVALETLRQVRSKALMYSYDIQDQNLEKSLAGENEEESRKSRLKDIKLSLIKSSKSKKRSKVNNKSPK
ncbi:MAG TPA: preprotein translocase subunit SecY, partial [Candidatus Saccharimonadales bacterium]|nr:preprotein translocase subunit SecY [Candidatus Saccharimonadales bacterium]